MISRHFGIGSFFFVSILNLTVWTFIGYYHSRNDERSICNRVGINDYTSSFSTTDKSRLKGRNFSFLPLPEFEYDTKVYPTALLTNYRDNVLGQMANDFSNHSIILISSSSNSDGSNRTNGNKLYETRTSNMAHRLNNTWRHDGGEKIGDQMLPDSCNRLVHTQVGIEQDCLAIVYLQPSFSSSSSSSKSLSRTIPNSLNQIRFNAHWHLMRRLYDSDTTSGRMETAGFFKVVGHAKGRARLKEKMTPLLSHLAAVEEYVFTKLQQRGVLTSVTTNTDTQQSYMNNSEALRQYKQRKADESHAPAASDTVRSDDVILMVVNEGELDLLVNFACSCEQHGLDTSKVVVFTSSAHLVPLIESLGHRHPVETKDVGQGLFTAVYHESFAITSHKASTEYLDDIFVDMMWYKAFSVYILLRLGVNVLFQDVDVVWFRHPFPFLQNLTAATSSTSSSPLSSTMADNSTNTKYNNNQKMNFSANHIIEAVFTDDGQRALRFAPFFANTGFYYLRASPRTERLAWSMLTLFDLMQRTGSHQNIMTIRLQEAMELRQMHNGDSSSSETTTEPLIPLILSPQLFPNGATFHHDKAYMELLRLRQVQPYNFHMCWTLNKQEKIENFKLINMWYASNNATCQSYSHYNDSMVVTARLKYSSSSRVANSTIENEFS